MKQMCRMRGGWSTRGFSGLMTWLEQSTVLAVPWWGCALSISPLSPQLPPSLECTALGLMCERWGWLGALRGLGQSQLGELPRALSPDVHRVPAFSLWLRHQGEATRGSGAFIWDCWMWGSTSQGLFPNCPCILALTGPEWKIPKWELSVIRISQHSLVPHQLSTANL